MDRVLWRAYRLSATCAAMTRCRSTTSRQLEHWQSLQRQCRLWPFRHDTTPWLRHLAHLGVRSNLFDDDDMVVEPPWPTAVAVDGPSTSSWFNPQRRGKPVVGSSTSSSSSEQPSMSKYSSDVSSSEAALVVNSLALDIVEHRIYRNARLLNFVPQVRLKP